MTDLKKVVGYISDSAVIDGKEIAWTNLYIIYPKEGTTGLACQICKCKAPDVLEGVEVGDYVELYYDDRKKIVLIQPVEPTDTDRAVFGETGVAIIVEE